jgi:hypothetical protein
MAGGVQPVVAMKLRSASRLQVGRIYLRQQDNEDRTGGSMTDRPVQYRDADGDAPQRKVGDEQHHARHRVLRIDKLLLGIEDVLLRLLGRSRTHSCPGPVGAPAHPLPPQCRPRINKILQH